jgi:NADPH:quinone reductase-like Zn-dependent oxidoreductase
MRSYWLERDGAELNELRLIEVDKPVPGPGEVLIRVRFCSLNFRDQLTIQGRYTAGPPNKSFVPLSDGAGEVEAVGRDVVGFAVGDRVAATFFRSWNDGPQNAHIGAALGSADADGMLREYVVLPASGVVRVAESLSLQEAATLPCAGVTAWNALMEGPRPVRPGDRVLVLGTGGLSTLALQIAHAAGAQVIATSSSDAKLERMTALGAWRTINYVTTPEWGAEAARLAGATGISHIVEVGGVGTLAQSIQAIGFTGDIALIGILADGAQGQPLPRIGRGASIRGVSVGSRRMAERLNAAIDAAGIKPVIDRTFPFEDIAGALRYQASAALFGKVVISV